jgi:hypothetical protein
MEEDYRLAVKDAVFRHQAGTRQGAAQLEAVGVRPPKLLQPVPPRGCVDLSLLPCGRAVEGKGGGGALAATQDLALQPLVLQVAAVAGGSIAGSRRLLLALQQYHRCGGAGHLGLPGGSPGGRSCPLAGAANVPAACHWQNLAGQWRMSWLCSTWCGGGMCWLTPPAPLPPTPTPPCRPPAWRPRSALDVSSRRFVDVKMKLLQRPARLADFVQLQEEHLQEEMEVLEGGWKLQVRTSGEDGRGLGDQGGREVGDEFGSICLHALCGGRVRSRRGRTGGLTIAAAGGQLQSRPAPREAAKPWPLNPPPACLSTCRSWPSQSRCRLRAPLAPAAALHSSRIAPHRARPLRPRPWQASDPRAAPGTPAAQLRPAAHSSSSSSSSSQSPRRPSCASCA